MLNPIEKFKRSIPHLNSKGAATIDTNTRSCPPGSHKHDKMNKNHIIVHVFSIVLVNWDTKMRVYTVKMHSWLPGV